MEHKTCPVPKKMELIITIINKDFGDEIAELYRAHGVNFNMIAPAFGAAGLEILDYLGLGSTEKEMIFSITDEDKAGILLPFIKETFELEKPNTGIAFTIPLAGISGPKVLRYISGYEEESNEYGK